MISPYTTFDNSSHRRPGWHCLESRFLGRETGLEVHCELDTGVYPKGIAVSDQDMAAIKLTPADFHGEWNYTISPNLQ